MNKIAMMTVVVTQDEDGYGKALVTISNGLDSKSRLLQQEELDGLTAWLDATIPDGE